MANSSQRDSSQRQSQGRNDGGNERRQASGDGEMSVREAGHLGGEKGGQRVSELVEKGKQAEGRGRE